MKNVELKVICRNDDLKLEVVETLDGLEVRHNGCAVCTNSDRDSAIFVYKRVVDIFSAARLLGLLSANWDPSERRMFLQLLTTTYHPWQPSDLCSTTMK